MNRKDLKLKLFDERDRCDWCGHWLNNEGDMHEWLLKRSAVPKSKKRKIFDERNCSLLHHSCHMEFGQTTAMKERLAPIFVSRYGKESMLDFIDSLSLRSSREYVALIESI